ncbi:uncharacterized protein [Littorina saxatilis]|uniref:EamA domain-containing protein n=1 Tax=Littorina saxatilis TaxID=31220 RepID=A0AAN9GMV1_9CAEN
MDSSEKSNGKGVYFAMMAGFSAAFASIFAKTAASEDGAHSVANMLSSLTKAASSDLHRFLFDQRLIVFTLLAIRGIGVLGIFVSNAVMWIFFSKSLQLCSSIVATVTNTAANFFFTACVSWVLFEEKLPVLWWCGSSLIVTGLLLVHHGSRDKAEAGLSMGPDNKKTV